MIKFILKLFRRSEKNIQIKDAEPCTKNDTTPDFIDYDGMGNQGRFPPGRRK